MGGWNSGRRNGRPIADRALTIDFAQMLRTGRAVPGSLVRGNLAWSCRSEPIGNIDFSCDMRDAGNAWMELRFAVKECSTGAKREYQQRVPISFTVPHFGGRRWWLHCPVSRERVGKLYCTQGGDIFASRNVWALGYHSQRISKHYRPFERLFALQRRMGSVQGYGQPLYRPKGMWQRTFDRHLERYSELDALCAYEEMRLVAGDWGP